MRFLVAVSGGVDSVVLLDKLVTDGTTDLTVAHFDHGIRPDSAADARFVDELARRYGIPFVTRREELGKEAGEQLARTRRYNFLESEARRLDAMVVTAHHGDDVVETIAINLIRGTGWRGVAVMDNPKVIRPLLSFTKEQIRMYALERRLEWVEDDTNGSDDYLRNRLRRLLGRHVSADTVQAVRTIWQQQIVLKTDIDAEVTNILGKFDSAYSRYFFTQIDDSVAIELLRGIFLQNTGNSITRPQLANALLAIKTARAGTYFRLGGTSLELGVRTFTVPVKTP